MHLLKTYIHNMSESVRLLIFYVLTVNALLLLTIISFPSKAVVIMSGGLDKHLRLYNYGIKAYNRWLRPTKRRQELFENMFGAFYQQNWPLAEEYVQKINYRVIEFYDVDTQKVYYLVQEKYALPNLHFKGCGSYVQNPLGFNAALQSPHQKRDSFTDTQAIDAFLYTQSKFLMLAGTRRISNHEVSKHTGNNYSASDVAHKKNSYYQVTHRQISNFDGATIFIQYHWFGSKTRSKLQTQCGPNNDLLTNLSEGVNYASENNELSIMHLLRRNVEAGGEIKVCVDGKDTKSLGGVWNVQGRHSNGSVNNCHENVDGSTKRFIHLKQSYNVGKHYKWKVSGHFKREFNKYLFIKNKAENLFDQYLKRSVNYYGEQLFDYLKRVIDECFLKSLPNYILPIL